jgi:hypothetical protein
MTRASKGTMAACSPVNVALKKNALMESTIAHSGNNLLNATSMTFT